MRERERETLSGWWSTPTLSKCWMRLIRSSQFTNWSWKTSELLAVSWYTTPLISQALWAGHWSWPWARCNAMPAWLGRSLGRERVWDMSCSWCRHPATLKKESYRTLRKKSGAQFPYHHLTGAKRRDPDISGIVRWLGGFGHPPPSAVLKIHFHRFGHPRHSAGTSDCGWLPGVHPANFLEIHGIPSPGNGPGTSPGMTCLCMDASIFGGLVCISWKHNIELRSAILIQPKVTSGYIKPLDLDAAHEGYIWSIHVFTPPLLKSRIYALAKSYCNLRLSVLLRLEVAESGQGLHLNRFSWPLLRSVRYTYLTLS